MSRRTAALTSAAAAAAVDTIATTTATPAAASQATDTLRAAYHDGPPEITYFGAHWRRGVAQNVTPAGWAGMRERSDFAAFDFRLEPATPAEEE